MDISQISSCISNWNQIRNTENGFNLITSGTTIAIKKEQFDNLKSENSESVHLYIGAEEVSPGNYDPIFFLTACEYDDPNQIMNHTDKIQVARFKKPPFFSVPNDMKTVFPAIAWERAFKWTLYQTNWFEENRVSNTIVRLFNIPTVSLSSIFDSENTSEVLLFFGIKLFNSQENPDYDDTYNIEIILSDSVADAYALPNMYENVTTPCPPYSCGNNGLLLIADKL